ncbi:hypothetical protein JB92DRAFT_1964881 [Gautieria morchelliformis]|nr:hypothetical protein JB92DRAFT_1964881 [Gautieria morchelliformis]
MVVNCAVSSMVFPTSMPPSGPESFTQASTSSIYDSMQSFKHFLDGMTPPDFSKLLRAKVKHLLKTWPPQRASTIAAASSSSSTSSGTYSPSFETVRAFAAFFRTQDSPGPSPMDLSPATSLQALHHHLLALQTLLSFLSARELQDIVRARLNESGSDRSAAVQGLMDVMRSSGGDDMLEGLVMGVDGSSTVGNTSIDNDGGGLEDFDQSPGPVPPSNVNVGKRKALSQPDEDTEAEDNGESPPPKKRQRSEEGRGDGQGMHFISESQHETSTDLSSAPAHPPLAATPTPDTSAGVSSLTVTSVISTEMADSTSAQSISKSEDIERCTSPTSKPNATSESQYNCDATPEKSLVETPCEISVDASDRETGTTSNIVQNSDEEDEGLVVTLIDDTVQHELQAVSPTPGVPLPVAEMERVASDEAPNTVTFSPVATSSPWSREEKQLLSVSFDADVEMGPAPGVSLAEWNRKRFRAAIGLPPKEPEQPLGDPGDAGTVISNTSVAQNKKHPDVDCTSSALVPDIGESVCNGSSDATCDTLTSLRCDPTFVSTHTPTLASPRLAFHSSRTPSPSLLDSDRGSPPGPVLRAVDWDARVLPLTSYLDDELDELDDQDGSEDTLAMDHVPYYNMGMNTEGVGKPSTSAPFTKGFSYRHTPMAGWHGSDRMWEDDDENAFDTGNDVDQESDLAPSQVAPGTESRRKLFIRLPARGSRLASTGTDVSVSASASASASISPPPRSPVYRMRRAPEADAVEYVMETGRKAEGRGLNKNKRRPKVQSPLSSGPSSGIPLTAGSGSATDPRSGSSHGASHVSSTSHTPTSVPGSVQYGPRPRHGPHPQAYPPPPPHGHTHSFPVLVYMPFPDPHRPHPHAQHQSHAPHSAHHPLSLSSHIRSPSMPSPPHVQTSPGPSKLSPDAPRSPRLMGSQSAPPPGPNPDAAPLSSVSAPSPALASGSQGPGAPIPPPEGPKRYFKRKLPGDAGGTHCCPGKGKILM